MKTLVKIKSKLAIFGGPPLRKKPFYTGANLGKEEKQEVLDVLKTGFISGFTAQFNKTFFGGPKVQKLESLFKDYFGVQHAVAMNSATSGLHAALLAVGVEPGDEVLVPPYTMSASASAILMCNAIPVFVDIEKDFFCMDPDAIEKHITPKTKAMIIVHLFGHAAKMDKILHIAKKHHLKIIEDCAQSPAATFKGKLTGTFGDVSVFSLNQFKTITCGEGGVALTQNSDQARIMQLIRNHGEVVHDHIPGAQEMTFVGWNYRMTELEAAVALNQFKKLDFFTEHRIRLADDLAKALSKFPEFELPKVAAKSRHVYFVFPFLFNEKIAGISRDAFVKAVRAEGVPIAGGYVRPIYWEPIYQRRRIYKKSKFPFSLQTEGNRGNYKKGSCPVAENMYTSTLVTTPICRYPNTKEDIHDFEKAIEKVFANRDLLASKP